jgi:hypothetical protein
LDFGKSEMHPARAMQIAAVARDLKRLAGFITAPP